MKIYFIYFFLIISLQINAQGFICAVGGGSEDYGSWSDTPYNWIVQKADSGKIFVLSYSDQTNWIPDYFVSLGAASGENIKISSRSIADQQSTYDKLITSKAIFIKGGDQYKYVNYWKGTKTEDAIRFIYENGGVISGTSAGAMILGDLVFTAKNGTAYSRNSLINPFDSKITLENDFLNLGEDLIFDTHFIERGRFGRLIAFIFNSYVNYGEKYIGIGIDDRTAICIDNNQIGYVFGAGSVSIFQQDERTKLSGSNSNYSVENLKYDQLLHGWEYDFKNNKITGYPNSVIQLDTNRIIKLPRTNIYLSGSNNILNNINNGLETYLKDIDSDLVGIITTVNYLENVLDLTNNFDMNNINYNLIFLPSSNENETIDKLKSSTCYIVLGDDLNSFSSLTDSLSEIGTEFQNKINSGIPIYGLGNAAKIFGEYYISNTDKDEYASYYGVMTNNIGTDIFGDMIFQPMIFENSDFFENRTSALLLGLMRNRKRFGIYCDGTDYIFINKINKTLSAYGDLPIIVLDAKSTTIIDSSHYITNRTLSRQTVGMNNLRLTVSNLSKEYSIEKGELLELTEIEAEPNIEDKFILMQNYPNPFNGQTQISFLINKNSWVNLSVYDLLGNKIAELVNKEMKPGEYLTYFDATNFKSSLSSGVYFYSLKIAGSTAVRKMIFLK